VVQQILADVTGRSFPELMQAIVLRPIGMVHICGRRIEIRTGMAV